MSDHATLPATTEPLDEAGGRALVEAWQASGLNGAAFCRQHNLRAQRLHYWRERLGFPIKVMGAARMTTTPSAVAPPMSEGFVQVVVGGAPREAAPTTIEVVVGSAVVRIHPGFDARLVQEVVRALSGGPC